MCVRVVVCILAGTQTQENISMHTDMNCTSLRQFIHLYLHASLYVCVYVSAFCVIELQFMCSPLYILKPWTPLNNNKIMCSFFGKSLHAHTGIYSPLFYIPWVVFLLLSSPFPWSAYILIHTFNHLRKHPFNKCLLSLFKG